MPPPRSLAQLNHPLRGVMTTNGDRFDPFPSIEATTLNADALVRAT